METKLAQIKQAVKAENWKLAFKMAKGFFYGFTDEEKRAVDIAHEAAQGRNKAFYKTLGIDTDAMTEQAKGILKSKYTAND